MTRRKQVIKLNEKQLKRVVSDSVRNILFEGNIDNEANSNGGPINRDGVVYYPIGNTSEYVRKNNLQTSVMYKVGKVKARPAVNGRQNHGTNLEGGFAERDGYVENGDSMIVRNPRGEEYQVPNAEFARKYTLDPNSQPDAEGYRVYNAFDKRIVSSPVKHNVYKDMSAYWGPGQKQFGRAGDAHIVNPDNDDSYFIGDKELKDTHVSNPNGTLNENKLSRIVTESVRKTLRKYLK